MLIANARENKLKKIVNETENLSTDTLSENAQIDIVMKDLLGKTS